MKLPRISISAIMTAVIVIALDCFTVRAFQLRGASLRSGVEEIALWVLPMTHVLAVVCAILVRDRARPRPFWIGFLAGGLIGLAATTFGQERVFAGLDWMIERSELEDWIKSMPESAFFLIDLAVAAIVFAVQLVFAVAGGWLAKVIASLRNADPSSEISPRRFGLAPFMVLVAIIAISSLGFEGYLRWKVDPKAERRAKGSEAVVYAKGAMLDSTAAALRTTLAELDGTRVRIDQDSAPWATEYITFTIPLQSAAIQTVIIHHRSVWVTLLDGKRAGEKLALPHSALKPIP